MVLSMFQIFLGGMGENPKSAANALLISKSLYFLVFLGGGGMEWEKADALTL